MNRRRTSYLFPILTSLLLAHSGCQTKKNDSNNHSSESKQSPSKREIPEQKAENLPHATAASASITETSQADNFAYITESFADVRILRYQIPGFDQLSLKQKQLVYYLYEAALCGRDIIFDQKFKHNLVIRRTLEAIWRSYQGDRSHPEFTQLQTYTKQVWFARGIHHDYTSHKFIPQFSKEFFAQAVRASDPKQLPLQANESMDDLISKLTLILFDPQIAPKRVNLDPNVDKVQASAVNFYEGVSEQEVEAFYANRSKSDTDTPISHGLNSKLVKDKGVIQERVWKVGGMYGPAIEKMLVWLEKAASVSENEVQKTALSHLIEYYKTGDLHHFDAYNIAWVQDVDSQVDAINGFIEVYNDPLGYRGTFESVVSIRDLEASKRIATLGSNAQWFEDHSPIAAEHKKADVRGISAKVISVVVESGDAAPSTPIGINLPNANWIRQRHGSKSVSLGNIIHAYEQANKNSGILEEFAESAQEIEQSRQFGMLAYNLKVDMHEVVGHASGQLNPGVKTPKETLKSYASTLEEARADLVALYFIMDPKLVELGLIPGLEVGDVLYQDYIRNGLLVQLARLELGQDLEESHMRNRQLISKWVYEQGEKNKVIEKIHRDGKTYFVVRAPQKLHQLFGQLLKEIQRIKSEGDFAAAQQLVENYGVKVDPELHKEVLARYQKLGIAPYPGFIQPKLIAVRQGDEIVDVKVEYPTDFSQQQLEYSQNYSFLPDYN